MMMVLVSDVWCGKVCGMGVFLPLLARGFKQARLVQAQAPPRTHLHELQSI